MGLFNFRPSVRPVPLEVHIAGFPGKHYCPRMATMNKPTFQGKTWGDRDTRDCSYVEWSFCVTRPAKASGVPDTSPIFMYSLQKIQNPIGGQIAFWSRCLKVNVAHKQCHSASGDLHWSLLGLYSTVTLGWYSQIWEIKICSSKHNFCRESPGFQYNTTGCYYYGMYWCHKARTLCSVPAVRTHSPAKPVLVFVSSRRQTRLTALDLIAFLASEEDPKQWLHMAEMEVGRDSGGGGGGDGSGGERGGVMGIQNSGYILQRWRQAGRSGSCVVFLLFFLQVYNNFYCCPRMATMNKSERGSGGSSRCSGNIWGVTPDMFAIVLSE